MNQKKICQKIWKLEKKFDLFNRKIKGIYFWKLARFILSRKICRKKDIVRKAHTSLSDKYLDSYFVSVMVNLPKILKNTYLHGAITRNTQKDILIFPHRRKDKVDGQYIDKFIKYFVEDLEHENYEIIDPPLHKNHYIEPDSKRSYDDHFSFINYLKKHHIETKLEEKNIDFLKSIKSEIKKSLDVEIDLIDLVKRKISNFEVEYGYYEKLIQKRKPKNIYLVVYYGHEPLIAAARDNGIKTIEFQHGVMNRYHLAYSFPNTNKVSYFPDKLKLFGKYWHDSTPLPENVEIEYYGFPYMENRIEEYSDLENKKNQAIFISQGTIGGELSKIAQELAEHKKDLEIVYKLHPGEYDRWQEEYPWLIEAEELENFRIIDSDDVPLYELLARSEYQVGIYSTAIYEGLVLDCKTILADLPGVEYMKYLIDEGYAKLAKDSEDVREYIEEDDFLTSVDKNYFFKGVGEGK